MSELWLDAVRYLAIAVGTMVVLVLAIFAYVVIQLARAHAEEDAEEGDWINEETEEQNRDAEKLDR